MAFRAAKSEALLALLPDLAVVGECSQPDLERIGERLDWQFVWSDGNEDTARSRGKGLGVLARTGLDLTLDASYDPENRLFLPIRVSGEARLNLLAAWTKRDARGRAFSHAAAVCRASEHYATFIGSDDTILVGDLNSSVIWDNLRTLNFSAALSRLEALGLISCYHAYTGEAEGEETQATYYFWRQRERPFHIDYAFIPEGWVSHLTSVTVGEYGDWIGLSDHCPLIIDLAEPCRSGSLRASALTPAA